MWAEVNESKGRGNGGIKLSQTATGVKESTIDMKQVLKEAALEAIREYRKEEMETTIKAIQDNKHQEEGKNYFKETEILLYNYPALKLKVAQDEEFLYNPDAEATPDKRKSKDIVRFSSSSRGHGLDIDRYTQGVKSSMMRTKQEVLRIERALETIKEDAYYCIIEYKYFDEMNFQDIAEQLDKDESTCRRNKNRLINKLKIMLFGADALNN